MTITKFKIKKPLIPSTETSIGLITNLPVYKTCCLISKLLDIELQIFYYTPTDIILNTVLSEQMKTKNVSASFDFMKWRSEIKNNTLYVFPNNQLVSVSANVDMMFSSSPELNANVINNVFLLPQHKHLDYIICFKECEGEVIDDIYLNLKQSKQFQLVVKEKIDAIFTELIELCYPEY